jgi:hypothetical protein
MFPSASFVFLSRILWLLQSETRHHWRENLSSEEPAWITKNSWHGGDILGNECRKLMAWAKLIFEEM